MPFSQRPKLSSSIFSSSSRRKRETTENKNLSANGKQVDDDEINDDVVCVSVCVCVCEYVWLVLL